MKTGMKCLILLCIGAALCYGIYSFDQVNRENDRLKVTTFSDRKPQTINGTEYTVLKNTICDYSKIKEQYPVIEPMLDVDGDVAKRKAGTSESAFGKDADQKQFRAYAVFESRRYRY